MQTLDLCRRFFVAHGYPLIQREFPLIADRLAAARIGGGSDVIGADDAYSRSGEWGPTFQVFLPDEDYDRHGPTVRETLNRCLPPVFEGHPTASGGGPKIAVYGTRGFLRERLGISRFPEHPLEWLPIREPSIRGFVAGEVFYDPVGELSQIRAQFAGYFPADVWKLAIARAAYACWLYGEYNFPSRLAPRGDTTTGLVARGLFVEHAMRLAFLLNRRYAPEWKWLHWEFVRLPAIAGELDPVLARVVAGAGMNEQAAAIVEGCRILQESIRTAEIVPAGSPLDHLGAFDVMRTLEDPELAKQPVRPV